MRDDRVFAETVRISFYLILGLMTVVFIFSKFMGDKVVVTNVLLMLTFIPALSLITALPLAQRRIKFLILAVLAEMVLAYYLAFHS
ncbi:MULTISPECIES: hypothetical protein [unclassified Archaeoglobus]|jgi:hypothetical protein|uniref:hypothetical protein n=1 Tax=unclassified Archaeoglobus TaxID=2643606 RepID=UPI0025BD7475|nr:MULTISPECIES: hypothetical protein [unclassified Archaeoglobus]